MPTYQVYTRLGCTRDQVHQVVPYTRADRIHVCRFWVKASLKSLLLPNVSNRVSLLLSPLTHKYQIFPKFLTHAPRGELRSELGCPRRCWVLSGRTRGVFLGLRPFGRAEGTQMPRA